jgi:HlyD family secretion protein
MNQALVRDLSDCSEFRLTLLARPPRLVHGTVLLLVALLGAAGCWLALTRASLVVRAPGRMRPVATPTRVFNTGHGEALSGGAQSRIAEVCFREGDVVRKGQVLVRLDTERLDNELAKRRRALQAAEEDLGRLTRMDGLLGQQYRAGKAKAEAELARTEAEVRQQKEQKSADVHLAEVELGVAEDEARRVQRLMQDRATSAKELTKARAQLRAARERLEKAKVPVNEGQVEVLRQGLALAEKDFQVQRAELAIKRGLKRSEIDAARFELVNLEMERRRAVLRAPIDGVVTAGDLKPGDLLEPGKAVAEVAAQKGFRFEALVPSDEVGRLRVGLPVRIRLDAYDYQKYGTATGTVCYIAPDSTLLEKQPTPLYLVRIDVDGEDVGRDGPRGRIRLGMAGQAEIVTDQESLLSVLLRTVRQSFSLD